MATLLLFVQAAHAGSDLSIKGVSLHQSHDDFVASHPYAKCYISTLCSYEDTLGGVDGKFLVQFDDDGVSMLSVTDIDATDFDSVAAALAAKFGKPNVSRNGVVSNAMGAKFDDRILVWGRAGGWKLQAKKRSDSVLKSSVEFFTAKFEHAADSKAAAKKDDI
ncbi:MAG TPA: hypothetical protein VGH81_10630 [Rudaea sp.]